MVPQTLLFKLLHLVQLGLLERVSYCYSEEFALEESGQVGSFSRGRSH